MPQSKEHCSCFIQLSRSTVGSSTHAIRQECRLTVAYPRAFTGEVMFTSVGIVKFACRRRHGPAGVCRAQ